jgi:hypothetical protein
MKRRHHAQMKQLALPVLLMVWTLLLLLWVIYLVRSN